jgi:hypothetical protein
MQFSDDPWGLGRAGGLWVAPVFLGLILILVGLLIFVMPDLLAFLVAAMLILMGCSLLGLGWHLRGRVTYRRMDEDQDTPGPFGS